MKKLNQNTLIDFDELKSPLEEMFGVPPFSIFDTTQGYWRKRTNEWKSLDIKSELGRGDNLCFNIGFDIETSKKNKYGGKNEQRTSVFDPVLCELVYTWFMSKGNNKILDCFAGGSVRGIVASTLGKDYTGVDLRKEQINANKLQFEEIRNKFNNMKFNNIDWICGDSVNIKQLVGNEKFDLLFSCPPYYDLEVYSEDPKDISNLSEYDDFLNVYKTIIKNSCDLLKENSFAIFVVGEIRDKRGVFRNFVGDTVNIFKSLGLHYYNEIILVNSCGSLPIRINKQFNSGRKIGKRHQNILVFYKGDVKNIKEKFGDVCFE